MRWETLFADLAAQSAAQRQEDFEAEIAEAVDLAWSRIPLADRLRAHIGQHVSLQLDNGVALELLVERVGSNWLSGSAGAYAWLIRLDAVMVATGLCRRAEAEGSPSQQRLGIGAPLRALAASRQRVVVQGPAGELAAGVLVGVGSDFLDLRASAGRELIRTVPTASLTAVRSADPQAG